MTLNVSPSTAIGQIVFCVDIARLIGSIAPHYTIAIGRIKQASVVTDQDSEEIFYDVLYPTTEMILQDLEDWDLDVPKFPGYVRLNISDLRVWSTYEAACDDVAQLMLDSYPTYESVILPEEV